MPEETKMYQDMFQELHQYEQRGVYMAMDGKPASPMQIVKAHMVMEERGYMRDYILDEYGEIEALYFHSVCEDDI